jgi:nicotinamidase-related amidase
MARVLPAVGVSSNTVLRPQRGFIWWPLLVVLGWSLAHVGGSAAWAQNGSADKPEAKFVFQARKRVETKPGSGRYHTLTDTVEWNPKQTAVVVCDMWDKHWCAGASRRVTEMAPRMNEVLAKARAQGALIIHCPSDTLDFYKETPQRLLAQQAPVAETKRPLERWCRIDPEREGKLPIDDSDGGCDCVPQCKNFKAWSREIAALTIAPQDAISDSADAFHLMRSRGITNVLVLGVHTNMCVLGRPFSIRQMIYQGQNVMLVRDMTDTMYNPRMAPFVHHSTGTDLVIEHIEKHWCPTVTSVDLVGGQEFRFAEDPRPTVAFVVGEDEYKTEQSLPVFAARYLGKEFRTLFVYSSETNKYDFPGMEAIDQADVLFISVRRRVLPPGQLARIRKFIEAGKPVIGIRTASHAFALRADMAAIPGNEAWPTFDPDVLGGHYTGHYDDTPQGVQVTPTDSGAASPLLQGVDLKQLVGRGTLYKTAPLAPGAQPLLIGSIPDFPAEPLAWTYTNSHGGKVFYTSLGHVGDFEQEAFNQLLVNALHWAAPTRKK